jgi:glycosyltransferase involved in cell wall biosynthesis
MKESLISCIVPVFNGERYLGEALDSILAQTYRPLKIIVADDGSTDGTAKLAAGYGERITYLRQSNQGYAAAKNLGLSAAEGDFIAFLDADDLWQPEKLARQMARLQERPDIDLCFTRYENFWMPELAEEEHHYRGHPLSEPQSAWSISTLMMHRVVFERFGNFQDGTRGLENMTWFLRASGRGAFIEVLSDILMYRRFNAESFTRDHARLFDNFFPILKEWRDYQRRRGNK